MSTRAAYDVERLARLLGCPDPGAVTSLSLRFPDAGLAMVECWDRSGVGRRFPLDAANLAAAARMLAGDDTGATG